jgi:predicted Zn-dependent protease
VRRWLEREPDQVQAWLWRAQVFERLLSREEAAASYRRVVELDPDNDNARLSLAGQLAQANRPQEALEQFERVRVRQGDLPPVLLGMARCRLSLNQPDEARRLLEVMLANDPGSWAAMAERGRLALQLESATEAETWFRRALVLMPFEKELNYGLYQCLVRLGKHPEAEEVRAKLKRIEEDLGRLSDLTRTIAYAPHNPALRCEAAEILLRNGQEAEALRWLESALEEDPRSAATHQALADYYEHTGDRERAERHRRLAREGMDVPPEGAGRAVP